MGTPVVLVTGCAGYIGSILTGHLLLKGCRVIGTDNFWYGNYGGVLPHLGHERFEFHDLDSTDAGGLRPLVQRADAIMPLAAIVGGPACEREPEDAEKVNSAAIRLLTRMASPGQRIIYPNTNSGYGSTDGVRACTEWDPMSPISVYGKTKCDGEKAVLDRVNGVSLRLATVFGVSPRMRFDLMVNDFVCQLSRHRPFSIFEPHFKRNFVHIRDVARAFFFMLSHDYLHGPFNLGLPDANLTKWELATTICDTLNIDKDRLRVGDGRDPDQRNYLISNERITLNGFVFRHGLVQGIREVATLCQHIGNNDITSMRNV